MNEKEKCKRNSVINSINSNNETFLLLSTTVMTTVTPTPSATTTAAVLTATTTTMMQIDSQTLSSPSIQSTSSVSSPQLFPPPSSETAMNTTAHCNSTPFSDKMTSDLIVHTCCYQHHRQLSCCRDGEIKQNTNKKQQLLLSVPLQRTRKKVVYNRDFIGAIGIDKGAGGITTEHRLIISHYSCVDKLTNMYTTVILDKNMDEKNSIAAENHSNISSSSSCTSNNTSMELSKLTKNNVNNFDNIQTSDKKIMSIDSRKNSNSDVLTNLKISDSEQRNLANSPISDEGCLTNLSPCSLSSDDEDQCGADTELNEGNLKMKPRLKVKRSSSSDSALGLDEDIASSVGPDVPPANLTRRMTLTVTDIPLRSALLPVAEPTSLPESSASQQTTEWHSGNQPVVIPSKMILEARVVEIPPPPVSDSGPSKMFERSLSRRQSSQGYMSDIGVGDEPNNRVRYVRTPSVVVSDYSDDLVCGITLEELEFFRKQRKSSLGANSGGEPEESDLSAASSCSNLNYCGSTISALDACEQNFTSFSGLQTPERKLSNCSTCSTLSDDEFFTERLTDALNNQQKKKKVCNHKTN